MDTVRRDTHLLLAEATKMLGLVGRNVVSLSTVGDGVVITDVGGERKAETAEGDNVIERIASLDRETKRLA